ncbi:MAG: PQQ-binding-like beta-propeller repeat protein [Rickettsia sp.]|nr:PQQ-binding-like beta-propeller repeat protein [Rickettsia sp.]
MILFFTNRSLILKTISFSIKFVLISIFFISCSNTHYTGKLVNNGKIKHLKNNYVKTKLTENKILSEPCINGSNIYILDHKGFLIAFSLSDQKILWKSKILADDIGQFNMMIGNIIYDSGKLYVSNGSQFLFVFDAMQGYEIIRKKFPSPIMHQILVKQDDKIIVQTSDGHVISYDFKNMQNDWIYCKEVKSISQVFTDSVSILGQDFILLTLNGTELLCLEKSSGNEIWKLDLESNIGPLKVSLFLHDMQKIIIEDFLFILLSSGDIIKIDLHSGQKISSQNFYPVKSLKNFGGKIFLLQDNLFLMLNPKDLQVLAKFDLLNLLKKKEVLNSMLGRFDEINNKLYFYVLSNKGNLFEFNVKNSIFLLSQQKISKNIRNIFLHRGKIHFLSNNSIFYNIN